ncbi:MAG: Do family serine endopeptidase [Gammaproteobacteria bacterium]|jgi:serine protease DegQ|nr:Do family serine endopeptidase [Gammaproteobacteria bacterium]
MNHALRRSAVLLLTLLSLPLEAGISPLAFGNHNNGLPTLAPMLEQVLPAVVSISAILENPTEQPAPATQPVDEFSFQPSQERPWIQHNPSGLGSGVIINHQQGTIVTNHHLIEGAKEIEVILEDGRRFNAEPIGSDKETDIALLRIRASSLSAIPLGDSATLRVGDFVIAVGNPFGLGNTATSGIVSALGRSNLGLERFEEFIQTDASINVGNSGGALVNLKGELVGINTAILAPNGGSVGIGFAIPVNMVREITNQLIQHGSVQRGYLGIHAKVLSTTLARSLRLPQDQGVVITTVEPGSPAERAHLHKGDLLTAINEHPINNPTQLQSVIGLFPVGKKIKLSLLRRGHPRTLFATIQKPLNQALQGASLNKKLAGALLHPLTSEQKNRYLSGGIAVHTLASDQPGWEVGLRPGDVIFSINRQPISSLGDAEQAVTLANKTVILRVYRGEKILEIIMREH